MDRFKVLAAIAVLAAGTPSLTTLVARATPQPTTLFGKVEGYEGDGAFPANVEVTEPVTNRKLYEGRTLVDVTNGEYTAKLDGATLEPDKTFRVKMTGLEAGEGVEMVSFVELQGSTPGTAQTGHLNISGYVLAGRIGLGTSPTIARVQINETGTIQGVRSITNSGVAVYGQATAGTGLASGGYFTTNSVGGRAMVGDALSTTGSTVGGLFYNRSVDGVAVWGRHINGGGNSIGVYGQTASGTGTAVVAENTSTGDIVRLGGANGTIVTDGTLPRHRYAALTTATMVPIAYGYVSGTTVYNSSGNFTVANPASGFYDIDIAGYTPSGLEVVIAAAYEADGSEFASWSFGNGVDFRVNVWDASASAAVNSDFTFVVYGSSGFNPPNMPVRPLGLIKYGELTKWKQHDPQGYAAWEKKAQAAHKAANAYTPSALPRDEAEPTPLTTRPVK